MGPGCLIWVAALPMAEGLELDGPLQPKLFPDISFQWSGFTWCFNCCSCLKFHPVKTWVCSTKVLCLKIVKNVSSLLLLFSLQIVWVFLDLSAALILWNSLLPEACSGDILLLHLLALSFSQLLAVEVRSVGVALTVGNVFWTVLQIWSFGLYCTKSTATAVYSSETVEHSFFCCITFKVLTGFAQNCECCFCSLLCCR